MFTHIHAHTDIHVHIYYMLLFTGSHGNSSSRWSSWQHTYSESICDGRERTEVDKKREKEVNREKRREDKLREKGIEERRKEVKENHA